VAVDWLNDFVAGVVAIFGDEATQQTLAWIGSSIVAVGGALYVGYKVLFGGKAKPAETKPGEPAAPGRPAFTVGDNFSGNLIGGDAGDVQQVGAGGVAIQNSPGATIGYTAAQHDAVLKEREAVLRADLERAHTAEKSVIQAQLDEVRRQRMNLEVSYRDKAAELEAAKAALARLSNQVPPDRLRDAFEALNRGETAAADALFAAVQAEAATAIDASATAAFERGKLAEADVRWMDAARHFSEAARLAPTSDHLFSASHSALRAGNHPEAQRFGEDLMKAAVVEYGQKTSEYATALAQYAETLRAGHRYAEAEPLLRQALAIYETTIGKENRIYSDVLGLLALLFEAMGRSAEAEPLYRQALAIDEKTIGEKHPDYAVRLNNFGRLLGAMGRHTEAEQLYQRALAVTKASQDPMDQLLTMIIGANLAVLEEESGGAAGSRGAKRDLDA
jgi:tetratricopeptide (TPR) repeat protein